MTEPLKDEIEQWLTIAESDFQAYKILASSEKPPTMEVCFHCQQCAEKYLKAFLQERMVRFERTHNLTTLLDLCLPLDQEFEKLRRELERLENYSVAVRYPGAKVSLEIAQEAFALAKKIREFVRTKL